MNILVRLPNWLGDMVMSTGFLRALRQEYPDAAIDVIVKKGLEPLAELIPLINHVHVFDRNQWKGLLGAFHFGIAIKRQKAYDLFFCLPDSFSSAAMGWGSGAKKRIGFKKELRSFLLTNSYSRPASMHRVEEYLSLLQYFIDKKISPQRVVLEPRSTAVPNRIILNFNSEAVSRRMPVHKGVSLLNALVTQIPNAEIVCIGSPQEKQHVDAILLQSGQHPLLINKAGQTPSLRSLIDLIGTGSVMLTTDSGPAHVANALGLPVVVLFGAGNEKNTSPYNKERLSIERLGQLPCEPCVKNTCIFGLPKCLELLEEQKIISAVKQQLT